MLDLQYASCSQPPLIEARDSLTEPSRLAKRFERVVCKSVFDTDITAGRMEGKIGLKEPERQRCNNNKSKTAQSEC